MDFLKEYHGVFDNFRRDYLTGKMVWNFADFMTDESEFYSGTTIQDLFIPSFFHSFRLLPHHQHYIIFFHACTVWTISSAITCIK